MTILSVVFNWDQKKTLVEQLWLDKEDLGPRTDVSLHSPTCGSPWKNSLLNVQFPVAHFQNYWLKTSSLDIQTGSVDDCKPLVINGHLTITKINRPYLHME